VTQVTAKTLGKWALLTLLLLGMGLAHPRSRLAPPDSQTSTQAKVTSKPAPAEALYLQLRSVGLDPDRTFHIRGASIDRSALHITLEDGEIAFTTTVEGAVTGAFFEGDGEILITPPNRVERASMTFFTGMAILEERFTTGYLRFNDQTFTELQPFLRASTDPKAFASHWNETARNLAEADALRLLATFGRLLPSTDRDHEQAADSSATNIPPDRLLHVKLQGEKLGTFDVAFDSLAAEQIWAGQARTRDGVTYYDLWTSFQTMRRTANSAQPQGLEQAADDLEITNYKIRAEISPPTTLSADAHLKVNVRRGGSRIVFFELSRFLQVKEVKVNGEAVEFINNPAIDGTQLSRRGNDLVAVVFPGQLRAGTTLTMQFVYSGDVLSDAGGGLLYVGARGTWYPNRGLQMSNFDLEFHYPAPWTLLATGKEVENSTPSTEDDAPAQPGNDKVARWRTERASTLAGFNLGRYEKATAQVGGVNVSVYAAKGMERTFPRGSEEITVVPDSRFGHMRPPSSIHVTETPSPARNAQMVADEAARAVDFFSKRFGPYPYSSLKLTQMPGQVSQGWPGLVFLTSFSFLTTDEAANLHLNVNEEVFNHLVLPHETAHQWWGDLVSWHSYRDQWIVEALSNYSALMMLEQRNPQDFRKALERYREDLLQKNKDGEITRDAGPVTLGQRLNSSHFPNGYEAISYGRGTWLFHMLRHMLLDAESKESQGRRTASEEPFVRGLRKLRDRYADKEISTEELLAVFAEDLPKTLRYEDQKSLNWFYDAWVEGTGLPHFTLQNVKYLTKPTNTLVSGTIVQKDAPDGLVTAVSVWGSVAGREVVLGTVFVDAPETPFRLVAPPGTKKVVLNVNQTILTSPK
jgi:hypothetical protein